MAVFIYVIPRIVKANSGADRDAKPHLEGESAGHKQGPFGFSLRRNWKRTTLIGLPIAVGIGVGVWLWFGSPREADALAASRLALTEARDALQRNDMDQCEQKIRTIQNAMAHRPGLTEQLPEYWFIYAECLARQNRTDEAIASLERVSPDDRNASLAVQQIGFLELKRNRARDASRALELALKRNPANVSAREQLIYILGFQLRRPELRAQFAELARYKPLTFKDVFLWNLSRDLTWDAGEAAITLKAYTDADPDDRWSRLGLADNLIVLNRLEEAEALLDRMPDPTYTKNADDDDVRARRARIALERGDPAATAALLEKGSLDHPMLARLRGKLKMFQKDYPAAVEHFQRALAAEPDHREAVQGLAQALRLSRADEKTVALWRKRALAHERFSSLMQKVYETGNSANPQFLQDLGAVSEDLDRYPEAKAWYQLALDLNPLDQRSQAALHRLNLKTP